jgi:hypothetical protein
VAEDELLEYLKLQQKDFRDAGRRTSKRVGDLKE